MNARLRRITSSILTVGVCTLSAIGTASSTPPNASLTLGAVLASVADVQRHGGNELTVLDALHSMEARLRPGDHESHLLIAQVAAPFDAVVGNYREALRDFPVSSPIPMRSVPTSMETFPLRGWRPEPALSVLGSMVGDVNIVMLNEAHHVPQHRAFAIELLRLLRKKGFRYFAAETLSAADTGLRSRGYPTAKSGYYTAEPVYGDLVRTALQLGYHLVAYEGTSFRNAEERERTEASNLVERVFKHDPQAKLLVYAGYGHIDEGGSALGVRTLAQRLREMTGRDPLTIDQTVMSEQVPQARENPIYRHLMARSPISKPTIFVNAQGQPWTLQPGIRDITLFQPRSVYVDGRPSWLAIGGRRKPYRLPRSICGRANRCLVEARYANESADAIPVDELAIPDVQSRVLMLPTGAFVIDVQDSLGHAVRTLRVAQR